MATPKSQRIGMWIIAVVMCLGMLGSFLAMGLSATNSSTDETALQSAYTKYQAEVSAQATELSGKYFSTFNEYATLPAVFDSSNIKELAITDLKVGDGTEIKSGTEYSAYYIGWNPKGVVFDQSISDGALKSPLSSSTGFIKGWEQGVVGMKIGGIRELTIPSDLAYGSTGSGDNIPADTPLKFIIMTIPKVKDVTVPKVLLDYYASQSSKQ